MADFGIGELTPRRPKIRTYLCAQTLYPRLDDCRAAELFMHFRLETLSLHAFQSHARRRETAATRHMRELCPSCKQHAETPTHFLLECPAYSCPRSLPHVAACVADSQNSSTQAPWRRLLNQSLISNFILRAWDIRRAALIGREANGGELVKGIVGKDLKDTT